MQKYIQVMCPNNNFTHTCIYTLCKDVYVHILMYNLYMYIIIMFMYMYVCVYCVIYCSPNTSNANKKLIEVFEDMAQEQGIGMSSYYTLLYPHTIIHIHVRIQRTVMYTYMCIIVHMYSNSVKYLHVHVWRIDDPLKCTYTMLIMDIYTHVTLR